MNNVISKKLHLIFLSKVEKPPDVFINCVKTIKNHHPYWEICQYNEDEAREIISTYFPELAELYYSFEYNVQRADILRVLVVYLFGGFYLDMDMYCLKNLDSLLRYPLVLGEEKFVDSLEQPLRIANYMFGSTARHPFWLDVIDAVKDRGRSEVNHEHDILESTGPGLLTAVYHQKKTYYREIVVLRNVDRHCLRKGHHNRIGCHFGNYAAHLHQGTWRWEARTPSKHLPLRLDFKKRTTGISDFGIENYINDRVEIVFSPIKQELLSRPDRYRDLLKGLAPLQTELSKSKSKLVLFNGELFDFDHRISNLNVNIWVPGFDHYLVDTAFVEQINSHFNYYVAPTKQMQLHIRNAGITIAGKVITPAFRRFKRRFNKFDNTPEFILGYQNFSPSDQTAELLLQLLVERFKDDPAGLKVRIESVRTPIWRWASDISCIIFGTDDMGWPVATLEAYHLGIPIIVPDTSEYTDILNSIPGILYLTYAGSMENKPASLGNAILEMRNNYSLYRSNALAMAKFLEDQWTYEGMRQDWMEFLRAIENDLPSNVNRNLL